MMGIKDFLRDYEPSVSLNNATLPIQQTMVAVELRMISKIIVKETNDVRNCNSSYSDRKIRLQVEFEVISTSGYWRLCGIPARIVLVCKILTSFFTWPVFGGPWEFWEPVLLHTKSEVRSNVTWMPNELGIILNYKTLCFQTTCLLACQLLQARMYWKTSKSDDKTTTITSGHQDLQKNHRCGFSFMTKFKPRTYEYASKPNRLLLPFVALSSLGPKL